MWDIDCIYPVSTRVLSLTCCEHRCCLRACLSYVHLVCISSSTSPTASLKPEPGSATHDVTITQSGTMGVAWKQMTVANRQSWPMVKAVKSDSVGAAAGIQPFEVLGALNGRSMDSATTPYDQAISMLRSTRPLHLSFMAKKAAVRATVTFVSPEPLGLQLEPATGDPVRPLPPWPYLRTFLVLPSTSSRSVTT
jgi:hypothetical protein